MWLQVNHQPEMRCCTPLLSDPPKIEIQNIKMNKTCETQMYKVLLNTLESLELGGIEFTAEAPALSCC